MDFSMLLQFIVSGISTGGIYGLLGLGFVVIYNVTGVINLAQGEFAMVAAVMTAVMVLDGVPMWLAACLSLIVAIVAGLASFAVINISMKSKVHVAPIISSIAISMILRGLVLLVWGSETYPVPTFSVAAKTDIAGAAVTTQNLWILGLMSLVMLVFYLFIWKTYLGSAMRASMSNHLAGRLMGIKPKQMGLLSFGIGSAVAAMGGITVAPVSLASYNMGIMLGLKGFAGAIIGGISNPFGAVLGGLVLGLTESLAAGLVSSGYRDALAFVFLISILILKPTGLFVRDRVERV